MPGIAPEILEEIDVAELLTDSCKLVLYNDDVNTFEHVINCLVDICNCDALQAEQLALMVHFKGKAIVKHGEFEKLEPMCTALCDRGLSATVE